MSPHPETPSPLTRPTGRTLGLACVVVALAPRGASGRPTPILHEYIPSPTEREMYRWIERGELPEQIAIADRLLPRPPLSLATEGEEPLDATTSDRFSTVEPDRETSLEGTLHYGAVFNPSVVPFKRMGAFDRVAPDLSLRVADRRLRVMPLSLRPMPPERTAFWGSVVLRLEPGTPVPLPSVAPEAAIVSYRARPSTKLSFFRDSADNQWVSSRTYTGILRLVWLTDAPRSYFSPRVPPLVTVADVRPPLRPHLSDEARRQGLRVAQHIGIKASSLRRQLNLLVSYFRSFQPGQLKRQGKSNYLDLALSQLGVCRHRAYAFVVTAQALGIPARYVQNEAHAFAEVFLPRSGWARIDLGGASVGLDLAHASDKTLHSAGPDAFPQPGRFHASTSRLRRSATGLRAQGIVQEQTTKRPDSEATPARRTGDRGEGGDDGDGDRHGASTARALRSSGTTALGPSSAAQGPAGATEPTAAPDPLEQATIAVETTTPSAFRGDTVRLAGRATSAATGTAASKLGGLRVEIYVTGGDPPERILLGATVTDPDGSFVAEVTVPGHLRVGDYELSAALRR